MYLAVQGSSKLPGTISFRIGVQLDTDYGKTHAHHVQYPSWMPNYEPCNDDGLFFILFQG